MRPFMSKAGGARPMLLCCVVQTQAMSIRNILVVGRITQEGLYV
jgi:hypothetical protein